MDVPPPLATDTPHTYADRLLRLWAVDVIEADNAERALGPMEVRPERVPDDVVDVLAQVRQASGQLHRPMIDCGHCWAERNGQADRKGQWLVVICEECDESWPCAAVASNTDEMAMDYDEHGKPRLNVRMKPKAEMIEITIEPQPCGDAWEDEDSFGYGHECRLPEGHKGDHVCGFQDDDEDSCRWRNWDDTPTP